MAASRRGRGALNAERVTHAETRKKLKELIVAKEDGVSPKDVSLSPVIEVGAERDTPAQLQSQ